MHQPPDSSRSPLTSKPPEVGAWGYSSPRVRSYLLRIGHVARPAGSISACAELPCTAPRLPRTAGVYLRVCGVTLHGASITSDSGGLSPRVRSYLATNTITASEMGSISACAELPLRHQFHLRVPWVYLRVCGVTGGLFVARDADPGLSPRVRSYRLPLLPRTVGVGSISACAELPTRWPGRSPRSWVYLRVCGVTIDSDAATINDVGLSPRVRSYLQ